MTAERPHVGVNVGRQLPAPIRVSSREPLTGHRAALAWTALVLGCLVVPASAVPQLGGGVRFALLLAFVCIAPGAAVACLVQLGDAVSSWAMAFVLSLALAGVVADLMVWTDLWSPVAGYGVLSLPTVVIAIIALLPGLRAGTAVVPPVRSGPPSAGGSLPGTPLAGVGGPTALRPPDGRPPVSGPPGRVGVRRPDQAMADLDATSVMPAIGSGPRPPQSLDSTMMLPLIAEGQRLDETVMLPMLRINDATSVLPRLSQRSDETMLVPLVRQPPPDEVLMGERPADEIGVTALRRARAVLVEALIVAVIAAVWLFSLVGTSTANVGDYGLISVLRPGFFVAVIACVARFVIELSRPRWRGWVLFTHTVLLVAIMHATVPLLVYEPEYAWTYKHVGVVELLRTQGHITNPLDIYQAWPTLFALVGHIVDGSGMNSLRIAAWAPVFFDLAFCVPLFAIARTLSSDRRVPYLTIFLFSAVDWVAQDYLSPQAYTYVLGLGTTFIMLRWLRRTTGRHGGPPGRIARLWAWVESGLAEVPYPSKIASRTATAVLYILYFVVVASHQLSPYLILMTACVLVALGLVRPLRIVFVLLAIAVAYLAPRYDIAGNYGLFSSFDFFNNAQSVSPVQGTTAGRVMSAQVVQYLSLVMWALAALTVVASWRRPGPIAVPAVLAFSPFGLLVLQSYGGEAIYRVYLFSIPWCAYLVATLMLRKRWLPRGMALPGAVVLLTLAIFGSMQGSHGQIIFNQFTRDEVAASTFIYSHAEPGADIVLVAGNFPTRLTANYDQFAAGANGDRGLLPDTDLEGLKLTPADLPKLNTFFDEKIPSYLVFSPSMKNYLHYFAYVPDGVYDQLRVTINGSPNWHIVYLNGDIAIYKFVP